jgi:hypothetical protein
MQYSKYLTYPVLDLNAATPGLYTLPQDASIESFLETLQKNNVQVFHLKGAQITTSDRYFEALAMLFQFPDYFGGNWDAVADCLTDLDWQKGDRIVVLYSGCETLLNSDLDSDLAMNVWGEAIAFWQEQGVTVALVMC